MGIRRNCKVTWDLSEMARQQSLPLNSLDLGFPYWGDSENMFSLPDFFWSRNSSSMNVYPEFRTGTSTCSHYVLGMDRFFFRNAIQEAEGVFVRTIQTREDTSLSKLRGLWLCTRARSIDRGGEASLARNVVGIGKLLSTVDGLQDLYRGHWQYVHETWIVKFVSLPNLVIQNAPKMYRAEKISLYVVW